MKAIKTVSAVALLMVGGNVMAASDWKSEVELGFLLTAGNTETQSTNAKGLITHETSSWRNEAKMQALNVSGKEGRLSEKYLASGKSSLKLNETSYSFIVADGEHDPFSGYAYKASSSVGYGYRAIGSEITILDIEAGAGFRQTRLRGVTETEDEGVLRLSGKFTYKLSKTAEFSEELVSVMGQLKTITRSVTAISAQVAGNFSMKASLTIENNSNAPVNAEPTDTETSVTLVYIFD